LADFAQSREVVLRTAPIADAVQVDQKSGVWLCTPASWLTG
jgi:hypothetical protein